MPTSEFIADREIYKRVIQQLATSTRRRLWIATADIKDMYVEKPGISGRRVPFLQILAALLRDGIAIRLIHAKEPGPAFRRDFDRFPDCGPESNACFARGFTSNASSRTARKHISAVPI